MAQVTADVVGLQLETVRKTKVLPQLFNKDVTTFSKIEVRKDVEKVSSRELRVPQNVRPNAVAGSFNPAGGAYGRGGGDKYDKATLTPVWSRIAREINEDVLQQTDGEPKSILNILKREIARAMEEFRIMHDIWLQTAGDGILATITALPGANVYVCAGAPFYTQLIREGNKLEVYDAALTASRGVITVSTVDHANASGARFTANATPGGTIVTDVLLPENLSGATPTWFFGKKECRLAA
jgi:hypothetical protein